MSRFPFYIFLLSLFVFGCGTPNDPEEISGGDGGYKIVSKYTTSGYAQDVVVADSLIYLAQGEGGLMIINISDPKNPSTVSSLTSALKGYSFKIAKKDSALYIAAGNFGVSTVNIARSDSPFVTLTNQGPRPTRDVKVHGDYLLTASSELGIGIAKVTDVTYPDFRGAMEIYGYARGLCSSPDSSILFVASGEMGLTMLDISDMQNGFGIYPKIGWIDTDGYANDVVCHPQLPYAYLACGSGGLVIIDYSDSADIKIAGKYNTGGYAKELIYKDGKIFITTETRGLQIIDVTNVKSPVLNAVVKTRYAMGICMDEKNIYIADELEGLIIIAKP
jgi:hypothetical protein